MFSNSPPSRRFAGKAILVTGGSRGIGLATARTFVREGGRVMIAARDERVGQEAAASLAPSGDVRFTRVDMADPGSIRAMVDTTVAAFGGLDVAFNNAGITGEGTLPIWDAGEDDFEEVMAINARGVWYATKYQFRQMMRGGGGAICITGSTASIRGGTVKPASAYFTSKHAVMGIVKQAAIDGAARNIRVNAVLPGLIETELLAANYAKVPERKAERVAQIPMRRTGLPEEVARAVLFLCSDESSYVTGVGLSVDGGATI